MAKAPPLTTRYSNGTGLWYSAGGLGRAGVGHRVGVIRLDVRSEDVPGDVERAARRERVKEGDSAPPGLRRARLRTEQQVDQFGIDPDLHGIGPRHALDRGARDQRPAVRPVQQQPDLVRVRPLTEPGGQLPGRAHDEPLGLQAGAGDRPLPALGDRAHQLGFLAEPLLLGPPQQAVDGVLVDAGLPVDEGRPAQHDEAVGTLVELVALARLDRAAVREDGSAEWACGLPHGHGAVPGAGEPALSTRYAASASRRSQPASASISIEALA